MGGRGALLTLQVECRACHVCVDQGIIPEANPTFEGRWGALAKTNYINLGFREPVYKNLCELVMTYFEHYVSIHQQKCLTGYTRIFDASRYTRYNWAWDEAGANVVYHKYFYGRKPIRLLTSSMAQRLSRVSDQAYAAETLFTDLNESFGNRQY